MKKFLRQIVSAISACAIFATALVVGVPRVALADAFEAPTGVSGVPGNGTIALSWTAPVLPTFPVSFNGTTYDYVQISPNNYISFTPNTVGVIATSAANPPVPSVHFCSNDMSAQQVYYKIDNTVTPNEMRVRFEGYNNTSGTVGSPNIITEFVFYRNQTYFDLLLGANAGCDVGTARDLTRTTYKGITNGTSTALSTPAFASNTNWRITGGTATRDGNVATWKYSSSSSVTAATMLADGFIGAIVGNVDDSSVRMTPIIASYKVQYSTDGVTWSTGTTTSTATPTTVTQGGLTNGTSYYVRVAAVAYPSPGGGVGSYSTAAGPYMPTGPPGMPTVLSSTYGDASANLSWTASADNGSPITGYVIQQSTDSGVTWTTVVASTGNTNTTYTVTGLTNGTGYQFRVAGINAVGTGSYATPTSVTPKRIPDAPTSVVATPGNGQATVTWMAPAFNGGATVTGYQVVSSSDGGTTWSNTVSSVTNSYTWTGLTGGSSYVFKVRAGNAVGWSAYSTASTSVTIYDVPGSPTSLNLTPGLKQVSIAWSAPTSNGGSAVTGYRIDYSTNGGTTWTTLVADSGSTTTSYVATGLSAGTTYSFRVYAINAQGTSSSYTNGNSVPYDVPAAPGTPNATAGNLQLTAAWTAGANNGSTITNYYYQYSTDGGTTWSSATLKGSSGASATITGLTVNTAYVVRFAAVNAAGTGPWSAASNSVTVYGIPDAPTGAAGVAGVNSGYLTWNAPASTNNSAITGYSVQYSVNGGASWVATVSTGSNATSYTLTPLVAASTYVFRVAAINAAGTGTYSSNSASFVPYNVPGAVSLPTATAGNKQLSLTWTTPVQNGAAITNYWYRYSTDGGVTWTAAASTGSTSTSLVLTGLTAGTSYRVMVAGENLAGIGAYSTGSSAVTAYDYAGVPTALAGTPGTGQVALSWTAPANNGSTITDYAVQWSSDNGTTWNTFAHTARSAASQTVTGLTNGTSYVFRVAAVNAAGTGTYTAASPAYVPFTAPGTPTGLTGVIGDTKVTLSWTAPASNGSAITAYYYQISTDGGTTFTPGVSTGSASTTFDVTGLVNGTSYKFRIAAANAAGTGSYTTASSAYVPAGVPSKIGTLTLTPGNQQVGVSWTAPASNGSTITDYTLQYSSDAGSTWTTFARAASTSTSVNVTGLTNGTNYVFRVAGVNGAGTGTYSDPSATTFPYTFASAPGAPTVVPAAQKVTLGWTAPANGGSAITNYSYQSSTDGGTTWGSGTLIGSNATSFEVTGLTNGTTYRFRVAAVNAAGTSSYSSASATVVPADVPAQVATVTPTAGSGQVGLSWSAPATNGSAITDYTVQWSDDSGSTWTTFADAISSTASATVTGLTNGTAYVFRVAAVNAMGTGAYSAASASSTPFTFASAPSAVTAAAGALQASLTWGAPANNGSAITSYSYSYSTDSGLTWSSTVSTGSTATSATVTGLTGNTAYIFRIAATNGKGLGAWSASSGSVLVYDVPGTPMLLVNTAGKLKVTLSWSAPSAMGSAITGYWYRYSTDNGTTWSAAVATGSATASVDVAALTSGTTYKFKVAAENIAGIGAYTAASSGAVPYDNPAASTSVSGTAGGNRVALTWTDGANNSSSITDHQVQWSDDNGTTWSTAITTGSASASYTVTGLTAQQPYVFRVASVNAAGASPWSTASSSVSPYGIPFAPGTPSGVSGNAQVVLSWTAADGNGTPITGYNVRWSSDNGATWSAGTNTGSTSLSYTVTGLTNGTSYIFEVAGVNAGGLGTYSADSTAVIPATVPSAVGTITTGPSDSIVNLSWTAPYDGGNAIVDYLIQYSSNSGSTWATFSDATSALTSVTVTGLTNGTAYVFRVAAVNSVGTGAWSSASASASPRAVASAPLSLAGLPGNAQVALSWQTPATNGGMAITDYTVQWSSNAGSTWTAFSHTASTVPSITVTGLTNGTEYLFRVAAVNSVGTGPWATISSALVPYTTAGAPTSVSGTPGNTQVALSWTAPANNGGNAVSDYVVEWSSDSGTIWVTFVDSVSTATTATVTGLTNGTAYVFRVKAVNLAGNGTASTASSSVTPRTVATAVQDVAGTPGNAQVALTWTAPASNGGSAVTDYTVEWSVDAGSTWNSFSDGVSTTASATVTGLTNGSSYIFRVRAVNVAGNGAWSLESAAVVPYTTAGAPTSLTATVGDAQVLLSWTAPASNGGTAVTDYTVQWSTNSGSTWTTWTHTASPLTYATISGLTNGTAYIFRAAAVNAAGAGNWSSSSSAYTPITVATAPTMTGATPSNTQVALTWSAPSGNGGSTITDYKVSTSTDGGTTWGTGQSVGAVTSITMSGLTNGTAYVFRVAAVNGAGIGAWSAASTSATPRTLPDAPSGVVGTTGNAQVSLVWSVPAFDGGADISDYVVQSSSDNGTTWTTFNDGTSTSRAATVTGLTNGTDYIFRVAAVNVAGTGSWSASSAAVAPRTVPAPPTIDSVTIGNAILTVNFTAGDSGGTTITGYEYSTDNGVTWRARTLGLTQSPLVITTLSSDGTSSLANGVTYDLKLRAVNAAGVGSASATFQATPLTVPTVATGIYAVPGASSATVYWDAPSFDGGTAITDYMVQYTADSGLTWTTFADGTSATASATVTGLSNGSAYAFRVAAVNSQGTGNWSVASASTTPRTVPGSPTGLSVAPGNQQLTLSWTAPSAGGAVITDYVVAWSSDSGSTWNTFNDGFSTATTATITGLTNGTPYLVRVAAVNIAGNGTPTDSGSSTTPRTVPAAPTLGLPTPGNRTISIPVTYGSNGGSSLTSLSYSLDNGVTWITNAAVNNPFTLANMTNGTTYTIRIKAVNAAGASAASNAVVATPRTTPGAPSVSSVTPANTGAVVAFTQPSDGGAAVSDYQYSTDNGVTWLSAGVTTSPVTISGLTNGTAYTIKIRAVNIAGTGTASTGTSVTPYTTPGAPTISQISGGIQSVSLTLAPGSNGGNAITNYEWSVDDGATWTTRSPASTSTSLTITGLADGTRYPVRIRAVNAAGSGAASAVANVSTNGVPLAPTINSVTATHAMLALSITPGANGGDPITNYEYSLDNGSSWVTRSPASTNTNLSITGLTDGYTYLVKVRAVNGVGSGAASLTVPGKPHTTPSTPVLNTQVDGGNQSLTVTFTPGFDGGEPITNYEYSTDRGATWRARTDGTGTASPVLITVLSTDGTTRLTNGVTYAVELRAVNLLGTGVASTDVSGTPKTTPDAPTISRVTPDDASATISFAAGGNGGSTITGYQYSTDNGSTWASLGTMLSPARITTQSTAGNPALVNGTTYQVKLRAVNAVGAGTATTAENLTPRTTPGSPTIGTATPGDRTITVSFTAGTDGGSTITSYEYSTDGGATWRTRAPGVSMTSTPITITTQSFDGLTRLVNGVSYDVLIRAVNVAGSGRESQTLSAIPSGVPNAPVITSIVGEDTRLRVSFTAGNPNGAAVTSNEYSIDNGATWHTTASLSSPVLITGLVNGTFYQVQLRHVNANGNGTASFLSVGKPMTRPSAVVVTGAVPGNTSVNLTWSAPNDGGDTITMYQYSTDDGATWRNRFFGTIETSLGIPFLSSDGVTPLVNGTSYLVKVRAVNGAGNGAPSDSIRVTPYTVPAAPVMTSLDPSDAGADVAYTLSTDGGNAVTSIDYSVNGGSTWVSTNSAANPLRISGLANGTAYSIVIRATNMAGSGNMSNTRSVAPSGRPDIPRINTVKAGNGTLTYDFTAGFDSGSVITGYEYSIDGGATWISAVITPGSSRFTVTGLENGVAYNTRIRAVNANGPGVASDITTVRPYTVPQVPAAVTATANTDSITLNYSPPAFDGGQPVTGYEYSIDGGTTWVSITSPNTTSVTIPNLTNTTAYTIQLRAVSAAGSGTHVSVRAQAAPVPVAPTEIKGSAPSASTGSVTAPVTPTTTKKKTKKKTTNKTTGGSSSGSSKSTGGKSGSTSGTDGSGTTGTTVPDTTDTTVPGTNGSGSGDGSNGNGKGGSGSNGGGTPLMVPGIAMTALGGGMWFAVVLWRRRRRPQDQ